MEVRPWRSGQGGPGEPIAPSRIKIFPITMVAFITSIKGYGYGVCKNLGLAFRNKIKFLRSCRVHHEKLYIMGMVTAAIVFGIGPYGRAAERGPLLGERVRMSSRGWVPGSLVDSVEQSYRVDLVFSFSYNLVCS